MTQPQLEPAPPAAAARAAKVPYPMLPHARPGGIAGLLELLNDRGGRENLYRLADDLALELDDLLPIVEAASLLGFLTVQEGAAEITPEGIRFAEAGILRRKELFKVAASSHVTLIRQIARALASKADHTLPVEFFRDLLDEHFTQEESELQIETAVNWGRYAELFDRDASTGRFYIPEETPSPSAEEAAGN